MLISLKNSEHSVNQIKKNSRWKIC